MIEVREASLADEEDVVGLLAELWQAVKQWYEPSRETDADSFFETLRKMITLPEWTFIVAVDGDKLVGMVAFVERLSLLVCGNRTYISLFVIGEECRGQGVGRLLLEEAKECARVRGCKGMAVSTEVENIDAIAFYEELGFEKKHEYLELRF